jgi:uncharacterized protein YcfJ
MRVSALLLACLLLSGTAFAQDRPVDENVTYGYAQVLRASPVYEAGPGRGRGLQFREPRRIVGYDVEYLYKGEKYMSRLAFDPGNRVRVRVSVVPEAVSTGYR